MKTWKCFVLVTILVGATVHSGCTLRDVNQSPLKDPVCGSPVTREQSIARHYDGEDYYFDREECARKFDLHPVRYIDMFPYVLKNQD